VDYTFAQVSITAPVVDYKGNCGNISSGVGGFAIDEGLVRPVEPVTRVRIHLTNTDNILIADVPVVDGKAAVEGDEAIDGCPGTGAGILLDWADTAGALTGSLLPTGNARDIFTVDGMEYEATLVDCANILVFIHARSLGMDGTETPGEIDNNRPLMETIEKIRRKAAVICNLVEKEEEATTRSPYNPFFCVVSEPRDYRTFTGMDVASGNIDIVSRLLFMLKTHQTHPVSGTVCLGAAARIPGSIAHAILSPAAKASRLIRIGHPAGVISVESETEVRDGAIVLKRAAVSRTARRIMDGQVYIRNPVPVFEKPRAGN
jgi:2-methylaconitate cis-trans-isomerase PrpF